MSKLIRDVSAIDRLWGPLTTWRFAELTLISPTQLAELWIRHAAGLRLLACMRTVDADDLIQEAFVRLSGQATLPDDPLAWLARVVRNLGISEMRAETRRRCRERQHAVYNPKWFEDASESLTSIAPEQVQAALHQLDALHRELVVAVIWNEMTFTQVAEVFALSHATAHRRYNEAISEMPELYRPLQTANFRPGETDLLVPLTEHSLFGRPGLPCKIQDISDGTSNTLMAISASAESAAVWTKPDDLIVDVESPATSLFGTKRDSFWCCIADGGVQLVTRSVSDETLRGLLTINGKEPNVDWHEK